jgi:hypothetical protein
MKRSWSVTRIIVTVLTFASLNRGAFGNLLLNGSFEDGSPDPSRTRYGQVARVPEGAEDIDAWEVYSGAIDYFFEDHWQVGAGGRYVDLHVVNDEIGGIRQMLPTVEGQTYILTFDVSGLDLTSYGPGYGGRVKYMLVQAGDFGDYITHSSSPPGQWGGWETREILFQALSASTWLNFHGNELTADRGNAGMWLDNISVEPVPEPSSFLLIALGMIMIKTHIAER